MPNIDEKLREEFDLWKSKDFSIDFLNGKITQYNETRKTTAVFRVHDGIVSVEDKRVPTTIHDFVNRKDAYVKFFQDVVSRFKLAFSIRFAFELFDEGFDDTDIPAFAFQRNIGSKALLFPDIDFMGFDFYESYTDSLPYEAKNNTAIFVGSTTGVASISVDDILRSRVPRIASAQFFENCPEVIFKLPKIVQVDSDETQKFLEKLGFGSQQIISWSDQLKNKFLISMDGNGATCSRVVISLKSASALLKYQSSSELFYFKYLVPMKHYVPIDKDTDVVEIVLEEILSPGKYKNVAREGQKFYQERLAKSCIYEYCKQVLIAYHDVVSKYQISNRHNERASCSFANFTGQNTRQASGNGKEESMSTTTETTKPNHAGMYYQSILNRIHDDLSPENYVEIGTLTGQTFKLARCRSIAIDPRFQINSDVIGEKEFCSFYQMRSDLFFDKFDPIDILKSPVHFAFLDGLHHSEFLLRDFLNIEKYSRHDALVAIHDCLPVELPMASRAAGEKAETPERQGWWTGDVWKTIVALKELRPDLKIRAYNSQDTGLVLVSNLRPKSCVSPEHYGLMLSRIQQLSISEFGLSALYEFLDVRSTDELFSDGRFIGMVGP